MAVRISTLQSFAHNLLGGSSGMNFYGWIKPPAQDVDVFEELGNPGWNWESYQRCTKRCEK